MKSSSWITDSPPSRTFCTSETRSFLRCSLSRAFLQLWKGKGAGKVPCWVLTAIGPTPTERSQAPRNKSKTLKSTDVCLRQARTGYHGAVSQSPTQRGTRCSKTLSGHLFQEVRKLELILLASQLLLDLRVCVIDDGQEHILKQKVGT